MIRRLRHHVSEGRERAGSTLRVSDGKKLRSTPTATVGMDNWGPPLRQTSPDPLDEYQTHVPISYV